MKNHKFVIALSALVILTGCDNSSPPSSTPPRPVISLLEQRRDKMIKQSWDISCGSAALATVLTYDENYPVTEREVAAELLKHTSVEKVRGQLGFSLLDLKNFAKSRGFEASGLGDVALSDLKDIGPAIVPVVINGFNHFVVFRDIHGDRVLLSDPAWGNRTMLLSQFLEIWKSRIAFSVSRPSKQIDGSPIKMTFHPLHAQSKDFVASSTLYQRPDIIREALRTVPEIHTGIQALNSVIAAGSSDTKK